MAHDIGEWLEELGLGEYAEAFADNKIRLEHLPRLSEDDLKELGVLPMGDRKTLLQAAAGFAERSLGTDEATKTKAKPSSHAGDEAERRQITIMFIDLVGSTQLSNELHLEAYREALHQYQNCCLTAIREHHGHVAQFIGDGVVAYFGYPSAEEDDAERAVLSGLDICGSIGDLRTKSSRPLEVRIGVSTGDVVIDEHLESKGLAFGETPNLAARIQAATEPGTVAISERTKQLLGANFECDWNGEHLFKGFGNPQAVWVVRSVGGSELRFRSRQKGEISPLVDRYDEIRMIESRWRAACRGEGQAVLISGEAGIGKSRLVEALSDHAERDQCLRLAFQCSPNHRGSAFFPVITLLNNTANITRTDTPERKLEKLKRLLLGWTDDVDKALPIFAHLLSIPRGAHHPEPELTPEQFKERLQNALIDVVLGLASRMPVLLLFEDLHWIDPSSEELLDLLVERLEAVRLLIICTYRPDYRCRWTGMARVTSLSISRLDNQYSHAMVRNLLATGLVPSEVESQIVSKTDGVPLFLEEMARMVRQRYERAGEGKPNGDILALPSTLKDLLRAKIDSLASAREIVPICAAIGRTILPSMVQLVSGLSFETSRALLDQLAEAQILVPRDNQQDRNYTFRHALIQDAAYDLMLPSRARALHRRIAEVMVESFAELVTESPDLLAQHYSHADRPAQARDAWRDAAVLATSRSATEETIQHLGAALAENDKIQDTAERETEEIVLRKMLNVALDTRAFGSQEELENFTRLHELLQRSGAESSDVFLSLHNQLGAQLMIGDPERALTYCGKMEEISQSEGDPAMTALTAHNQGVSKLMLGEFEDAVTCFERALDLRDQTSSASIYKFHASDIRIVDIAMRCWALALDTGDSPALRSDLADAIAATEVEEHDFSRCFALNILAAAHQCIEDPEAVLRVVASAVEISHLRKFEYWGAWSKILRGWARARSGDPAPGIAELIEGIEAYLSTGSTQIVPYARTLLADAYLGAGEIDSGLAVVRKTRSGQETKSVRFQASITDRVESELIQAEKRRH